MTAWRSLPAEVESRTIGWGFSLFSARQVTLKAEGAKLMAWAGHRAAFARPVLPAGCQLVWASVKGGEE